MTTTRKTHPASEQSGRDCTAATGRCVFITDISRDGDTVAGDVRDEHTAAGCRRAVAPGLLASGFAGCVLLVVVVVVVLPGRRDAFGCVRGGVAPVVATEEHERTDTNCRSNDRRSGDRHALAFGLGWGRG